MTDRGRRPARTEETRKQKMDRQQGHAADRAFDPIRAAIDSGELVITPVRAPEPVTNRVIITDREHPHYGEMGVFTGEVITFKYWDGKMALVKLDHCLPWRGELLRVAGTDQGAALTPQRPAPHAHPTRKRRRRFFVAYWESTGNAMTKTTRPPFLLIRGMRQKRTNTGRLDINTGIVYTESGG